MRRLKSFCIILIILISISVTNFASLLGDIDLDGDITINDLAILKLHLIGKELIEGERLKTADLDGDGKITINDLAKLKLILIGKEDLKCVNNIEELKQSNAKLGDKYKTLGYYLANDGGNGKYEIIQKTDEITIDNGLFIELKNGLVAKLITENKTANIKQFGAKGDGKTDDSKAIETALNSKIENLDFPKADYKITNFISLNNGGVAVSGNDSVIFTDNDYKPSKYSEFLFIVNGEDYTFTSLNFEARETKNLKDLYSAQIYVGGTNIEFNTCDFTIPETTSSEHQYNNLDLYTGWHNVKIENCNLYLANDGAAGGCIWIRDLFNRGASGLIFKNNTCYKKCHDEILAVFMGTIENVEITNNKFIMPESTDPSVMCFTIGSNSSKKADNIKFENNEIDCASVMDLFVLKNSSNVSIKNNNIKYTKQDSTSNNYLIYIPEGIVTDLDISENIIEINNNSKKELNAIMNSISSDVTFTKNKITVNSDMSEAFSGGIINKDNEIIFNGNLHVIANKPRIFDNNKIILNGKTNMFFQYYKGKLEWESNITNNNFENNCNEIAEKQQSTILMFNEGALNNHIVNFSDNIVKCENPNLAEDRLYTLTLTDETPQTIKILNNNIEGYEKEVKWQNKAEHIIIKDENEIIAPNTEFKGFSFEEQVPEDKKVTFERVLMQNKRQVEYGINGAGSQWPVALETSSTGDLMLYGIDVAGLYKSTDHGKNWTLACNGFASRGIGMFAIDPHNSNHVLAVGLGNRECGGVYVSYDKAETWAKYSSENNLPYHGARYIWDGLEFDPTSFNKDKNLTLDAYYSIPYKRDSEIRTSTETPPKSYTTLKENEVGLYKSTDGGKTFKLIINDKKVADGIVRITENGNVYVGNQYGLFLIDKENNKIKASYLENDGEKYFAKGVTGLDVVQNTIYAQTWDGIYTLNGEELTKITNEDYKSENWPQFLTVSKSNPNHMIYQYRSIVTNYYVNATAVSFDGGKTWKYGNANLNTTFYKSSWVGREKNYIIDPSNDNNVITFGSDTLMRSEDGGLNFVQASGVSNMMQGGKFNFNYYDPDLILFSAQDYTGVITTDGGKTYERFNITGGKGNFYGGFAADRDTYFGFANTSWGGGTLSYTHDGGDTWTDTGLEATGVSECRHYSSLQSPTNPNALFAVEYYSKDKGYTWNKMNGCTSVYTYNYTGKKELYGGNADGKVVVSYDNGDTWNIVCDKPWNESSNVIKQTILDLAYDHVNNYIYAVVQVIIKGEGDAKYTAEAIYKLDINKGEIKKLNIPVDTDRGYMRQNSIAIDPNATSVIYVGGNGGYFSSATALVRSIDGGETWKILTSNNMEKYPSFNNNQGGYEVTNVRVNPYDGKVWIACGCYGYETFDPPYDAKKLSHEKPQEHTIKYVYNGNVVNEVKVRNNETHKYIYDEDGLTFVDWYIDKEFKNSFSNGSRVYNSMVLYAKMKESTKVEFYDRENLLWKIDLDAYDLGNENLIPTREGYAFAGWYKDSELSEVVDFDTIEKDAKVYAGWYKIVEDIFDINAQDIGNYIAYNDDHRIQDGKKVENNADVDDRCVYTNIDTNSTYYISFKMDTRCRIGLGKYAFWQYNPVKEYFIDEDDNNGKIPANKYVFKTISSGECDKMLVYYYTVSGSKEYMDIKNTFKIYKIENTNVKENL